MNKIINTLQRTNTLKIQDDEAQYEKTLSKQSENYFIKVKFLSENIEEEWLRQNHLPANLRCCNSIQSYNILCHPEYADLDGVVDKAEMIIKDPYLDEVLKGQESE